MEKLILFIVALLVGLVSCICAQICFKHTDKEKW